MQTTLDAFLRTLCTLRWLALAGQAAAVLIASGPIGIALPLPQLWLGIAALAAFNVVALWRARRGAGSTREAVVHLGADILALLWMVAWSGGIANPFSSLFLLPIAIAALMLELRAMLAVAAASVAAYALAAVAGSRLVHLHAPADAFDLHLIGMAVNFAVSALVVICFFTLLLRRRQRNEREIAELRERFARNEGIVALATHAASVAHELNTPLATVALLLEDLRQGARTPAEREDHRLLRELIETCTARVRELATSADAAHPTEIDRVIEHWQLIRPTVALHRSGALSPGLCVEPAVAHLLQALLNNAADASLQAGRDRVDLDLSNRDDRLEGAVRDYGRGFSSGEHFLPKTLFASRKPSGLGIGLALSHATIERLRGELTMAPADDHGVCVQFKVPLMRTAHAGPGALR